MINESGLSKEGLQSVILLSWFLIAFIPLKITTYIAAGIWGESDLLPKPSNISLFAAFTLSVTIGIVLIKTANQRLATGDFEPSYTKERLQRGIKTGWFIMFYMPLLLTVCEFGTWISRPSNNQTIIDEIIMVAIALFGIWMMYTVFLGIKNSKKKLLALSYSNETPKVT